MTEYPVVRCSIPAGTEDEFSCLMNSMGILGCEVVEEGGETVELKVYVDPMRPAAIAEVEQALAGSGALRVHADSLHGRDWLEAYRLATRPFAVGDRWWMDPHPESPTPAPDGRTRLAVEPRMAFGSGSHESTQLVLLELEQLSLRGRSVLDVGTGSGILALASRSLGAWWALGFDVDPQAIWVARQVAEQQDGPVTPDLLVGTVHCLGTVRFDVILCNMISDHFLPMLGSLRDRLAENGTAVFSGMLEVEDCALRAELTTAGFEVVHKRRLNEWMSFRVRLR